jgi:hypothetical protein
MALCLHTVVSNEDSIRHPNSTVHEVLEGIVSVAWLNKRVFEWVAAAAAWGRKTYPVRQCNCWLSLYEPNFIFVVAQEHALKSCTRL